MGKRKGKNKALGSSPSTASPSGTSVVPSNTILVLIDDVAIELEKVLLTKVAVEGYLDAHNALTNTAALSAPHVFDQMPLSTVSTTFVVPV